METSLSQNQTSDSGVRPHKCVILQMHKEHGTLEETAEQRLYHQLEAFYVKKSQFYKI